MPPQDGTPCIVGGLGAFWPGRPRTAPPDHSGTDEQPLSGLIGDTIDAPAGRICHHRRLVTVPEILGALRVTTAAALGLAHRPVPMLTIIDVITYLPENGMTNFTYADATRSAEDTIVQLTAEARGQLDESNQSYWDMANGVLRMWITLAGAQATMEDKGRLQLLIDDMPGVDDDGEGNWKASPVVILPASQP
jgi:hypothetical protein